MGAELLGITAITFIHLFISVFPLFLVNKMSSSSSSDFPFGGTTDQLKAWLTTKYGELGANIFQGFDSNELQGQTEAGLIFMAPANNLGRRIYGALQTAKENKASSKCVLV